MTDEERQRTMDFIVAQQAQFWANMQELKESTAELKEIQKRAEARMERTDRRMERADQRMEHGFLRIDRLERVLKLMIKAGQRARKHMRERDEKFERRLAEVTEIVAALGEAQTRSDRKLDSLLDLVREQRNGEA